MSEVDYKTVITDKAKKFLGDVNEDLPDGMELKFEGFSPRKDMPS